MGKLLWQHLFCDFLGLTTLSATEQKAILDFSDLVKDKTDLQLLAYCEVEKRNMFNENSPISWQSIIKVSY